MNSLRKVFGFLLAGLMLAAFASPGIAQTQKIFTVTMSYSGSGTTYRALFTNTSPGNSTINSVKLTAPSGVTITTAVPSATNINTLITGIGTNEIDVSYMPGIKAQGGTWYLDVTLSAASPTCVAWNAQAFAGNAFSQPFTLVTSQSTLMVGNSASACQIVVTMPTSVTENTTPALAAVFANPSTNAASFSALTLQASSSAIKITGASLQAGTTGNIVVSADQSQVTVTNISPAVQSNSQLTLTLNTNVPATCNGSDVTWTPIVYVGPSASGASFSIAAPPTSQLKTTVNAPACAINFSPDPPTNKIVSGGTLPTFNVTTSGGSGNQAVTISASDGCAVGGTTTVTASGGTATFSTAQKPLTVSLSPTATNPYPTTCALTASATGYASVNSKSFTVYAGTLACGDSIPLSQTDPSGLPQFDANGLPVSGWAGDGARGSFNKDGGNCVQVNYTFLNEILTADKVVLQWDTAVQPNAAMTYSMNWQPEWADPVTGLPKPQATLVQWFLRDGTLAPPSPVPGRGCLTSQLPSPFGTLASFTSTGTSSSDTATFTLSGAPGVISPVPTAANPVPVFIGDGTVTERLLVTGVSSGTYTAMRAQGGTTAASPVVGTAKVMSNPLPLDASGNQMQVCFADQGFNVVPKNLCTSSPPSNPAPACVVVTTTVFDIGDASIIRQP